MVSAQGPTIAPFDPLEFARVKDFAPHRSSSNNPDPRSNDDSKRPIPGQTVVLADLKGPGFVSHIWLTIAANEYGWPRLLRLRVYYDGSPVPSVDAPVGDFFGVGHGLERPLNSLMVRDSSSGRSRNSYWPMPFRQSCKITITNEGRRRVSNLYYHVDWEKLPTLPADIAYFHARYRQALPAAMGKPVEILKVDGRGHYVGTVLSAVQNQAGWFGEGDDLFYIDGKKQPDIEGTGTEDYANDAWSFRVTEGPYAGVTVADGTDVGARMTAYRWHIADPIPFKTSLRFDIEHAGWTFGADGSVRSAFEERPDLFSTVAFWYHLGIARDQPEPPYGSARLPQGNAQQIEAEGLFDRVKTSGGKAVIEKEVFWSKDLLAFKATSIGARIDVPLDVPADGYYEVIAQMGMSPDYGVYSTLIDDKPTGASVDLTQEAGANTGAAGIIDSYYTETFVGEDRMLAWRKLTKGEHTVSFVCTGKNALATGYNLGIDALVLARVASEDTPGQNTSSADNLADQIRQIGQLGASAAAQLPKILSALGDAKPDVRIAAAWSLSQMGTAAAPAVDALIKSLDDEDPIVRGLVALSLRDAGPSAERAVAALTAHLADPDENVRMVTAQALAARGIGAKSALQALMDACRAPGQHVHVLRSLADALGAIGPDAAPALPVLRELIGQPRVQWAAEAAVAKIQK